ncbi:hypothetical protein FRB98_006662 [Tulasnella sp. 332]|nr:hypothetical protein FRB98_006662 [Tulasnella sp. 332]
MVNVSGTLNAFRALVQPRLIVPSLTVKTIGGINFRALKDAGYVGAVFDKDNCLTVPYEDRLAPEIKDAWAECKEVFGRENVLLVSNSAGTRNDAGLIAAESVSVHLGVPILAHTTKKPGCIEPIMRYFASQRALASPLPSATTHAASLFPRRRTPTEKIIVVGDRLFTDVLMANRMGAPVLSIWTTGLWVKEAMLMRAVENALLQLVLRYRARRGRPQEDPALRDRFTRPEIASTLRVAPFYPEPPTELAFLWQVVKGMGNQTLRLGKASYRLATESEAKREAKKEHAKKIDDVLQADPTKGQQPSTRRAVWVRVMRLLQEGRGRMMSRLRGQKGDGGVITQTPATMHTTRSDSSLLDKAQL